MSATVRCMQLTNQSPRDSIEQSSTKKTPKLHFFNAKYLSENYSWFKIECASFVSYWSTEWVWRRRWSEMLEKVWKSVMSCFMYLSGKCQLPSFLKFLPKDQLFWPFLSPYYSSDKWPCSLCLFPILEKSSRGEDFRAEENLIASWTLLWVIHH